MGTGNDNSTVRGLTVRRMRGDSRRIAADPTEWRARLEAHRLAFERARDELPPVETEPAPDGPDIDRAGEAALVIADKYETDPEHPETGPLVARFAQEAAGLIRFLLVGEIEEQRGIAYMLTELLRPPETIEYPLLVKDPDPLQKLIIARKTSSSMEIAMRILQRSAEEDFEIPSSIVPEPVYAAMEACVRALEAATGSDPLEYSDPTRMLDAAVQAAYIAYLAAMGESATDVSDIDNTDRTQEAVFSDFIRDAWPAMNEILASKYITQRWLCASGRTDPAWSDDPYIPDPLPRLLVDDEFVEATRISTRLLQEQADAEAAEAMFDYLPCDCIEFVSTIPPAVKLWRNTHSIEIVYNKGYEDGMVLRLFFDDSSNPGESRTADILVTEKQTVLKFDSVGLGDSLRESQVVSFRMEHFPVTVTENPAFSFFDPDSPGNRWIVEPVDLATFDAPGSLTISVEQGPPVGRRRWTITEASAQDFIISNNILGEYQEGSLR